MFLSSCSTKVTRSFQCILLRTFLKHLFSRNVCKGMILLPFAATEELLSTDSCPGQSPRIMYLLTNRELTWGKTGIYLLLVANTVLLHTFLYSLGSSLVSF